MSQRSASGFLKFLVFCFALFLFCFFMLSESRMHIGQPDLSTSPQNNIEPVSLDESEALQGLEVVVDRELVKNNQINFDYAYPKVKGYYFDKNFNPIVGASVELWRFDQVGMEINQLIPYGKPEQVVMTNLDGSFDLSFLDLLDQYPDYALRLNQWSYNLVFRHPDFDDLRVMELPSLKDRWEFFANDTGITISGRCLNEKGQAVPKVGVYINNRLITWSDDDGFFSAALGAESISASQNDLTLYLEHDDGFYSSNIALSEPHLGEIILEKSDSVYLSLYDESGAPLPFQLFEIIKTESVSIAKIDGRTRAIARANGEGKVVFRNMSPGLYECRLINPILGSPENIFLESLVRCDSGLNSYYQPVEVPGSWFNVRVKTPIKLMNISQSPIWYQFSVNGWDSQNSMKKFQMKKCDYFPQYWSYYLPSNGDSLDSVSMKWSLSGYGFFETDFVLDKKVRQYHREISLLNKSESSSATLTFHLPDSGAEMPIQFELRPLHSDLAETFSLKVSENKWFYPLISAGDYIVDIDQSSRSFFSHPNLEILQGNQIRIESGKSNLIDLEIFFKD